MERDEIIIDLMEKLPRLSVDRLFYLNGLIDNCLLNEQRNQLEQINGKARPTTTDKQLNS